MAMSSGWRNRNPICVTNGSHFAAPISASTRVSPPVRASSLKTQGSCPAQRNQNRYGRAQLTACLPTRAALIPSDEQPFRGPNK
jgi:hypothetical protein